MTYEEEIREIDEQIFKLKNKKEKLVKEHLNKTASFEEKFYTWFYDAKKIHSQWIPRKEKFPLLRQLIDDYDYKRHMTIDIEDRFEEKFGYFLDPDLLKESLEDGSYTKEDYDKDKALAEEIMNANLGSFTIDW